MQGAEAQPPATLPAPRFDFYCYTQMNSVLEKVFFPTDNPTIQALSFWGVYAAAFVVRCEAGAAACSCHPCVQVPPLCAGATLDTQCLQQSFQAAAAASASSAAAATAGSLS